MPGKCRLGELLRTPFGPSLDLRHSGRPRAVVYSLVQPLESLRSGMALPLTLRLSSKHTTVRFERSTFLIQEHI